MKDHLRESSNHKRQGAWLKLIAGTLLLTSVVILLMQGYAPPGPAGDVFRNNLENRIDATPLFYTEVESLMPDE